MDIPTLYEILDLAIRSDFIELKWSSETICFAFGEQKVEVAWS